MENLLDKGVNLDDLELIRKQLGEYAFRKILRNEIEEVYTEYRTKKLLERR